MRISRASAECAEREDNAVVAPLVRPSWGQLNNFLEGSSCQALGESEDVSSGSSDLLSQIPLQTWFRAVWYLSV